MQERKSPYLKVVSSRRDGQGPLIGANDLRPSPEQLSLPYPDPFTVLIAHVENLKPENFLRIVGTLRPRWIIDARIAPRMDVVAGSRSYAFSLFHSHQIEYVDLFGKLGLSTSRSVEINPALWVEKVGHLIKSSRHPVGPFLVLFDRWDLFNAAKLPFATEFGAALGRPISLAVLDEI